MVLERPEATQNKFQTNDGNKFLHFQTKITVVPRLLHVLNTVHVRWHVRNVLLAERIASVADGLNLLYRAPGGGGEGGGHFRNFWVWICRWEPGTLNLFQS